MIDRLVREVRLLGRAVVRSLPEFALFAVMPVCVLTAALVVFGVWS